MAWDNEIHCTHYGYKLKFISNHIKIRRKSWHELFDVHLLVCNKIECYNVKLTNENVTVKQSIVQRRSYNNSS